MCIVAVASGSNRFKHTASVVEHWIAQTKPGPYVKDV
jgi:hypothetical protein